jgi:hypothetical protein
MRKAAMGAAAATCFFGVTSFAALAASAFEGVWKVKDTAGHPFEITLSSGGAAKATRGEGMTGTWKEEGNSAVITWNTGWTTKITKEGDRYIKTAYGKGQSLTATPTNTSDAKRPSETASEARFSKPQRALAHARRGFGGWDWRLTFEAG